MFVPQAFSCHGFTQQHCSPLDPRRLSLSQSLKAMLVMHSGPKSVLWLQGFEEHLQLWQEVRYIQPDNCNHTEYSFALSVAP